MLHKGKLLIFLGSAVVALYGISAAFYGRVVATDQAYPALSVFMDALNKVSGDYVEAPDMTKVQEGAMRGLIDALDPYSCFLTRQQAQELEESRQKATAGIGVVLSKRGDVLYVVSVSEDGPAARAGIRPGDYVIGVDEVGTEDKSILECDAMLRGAPESTVKLSVFRGLRSQPVEIAITRTADTPPTARTEMLQGRVGLLDVSSLRPDGVEQARVRLKTLIAADAQGLILDLRDCADGAAEDGAELARFFLRSGVIYSSRDRDGKLVHEAAASAERFITDLPLVVLTNASTAGAAEIAAGALKDQGRAKLVGEKTFGSGSAQKKIMLKSGAMLILSTARFYTPSGKMIQEDNIRSTGIKPDILCPDSDRRQEFLIESYFDEKEESIKYNELRTRIAAEQLEKALEVLRTLSGSAQRAA